MGAMADHDLAVLRLSERDWEMWNRYLRGEPATRIADDEGLPVAEVRNRFKLIRNAFPAEDLDDIRREHLEELKLLTKEMWDLVRMEGAPVTSGKDGLVVLDPDTGVVVRDYGQRIAAAGMVLKIQERAAKLIGVDAPVKAQVTVESESIDGELMELARQLGLPGAAPVEATAERLDEGGE